MATTASQPSPVRFTLPASTLLVLALAACSGERAEEADYAPTPQVAGRVDSATVPALPLPASATPSADRWPLARFDGYGDLRFGMTADEARQAWGGDLNGRPGAGDTCYHLSPVSQPSPAYFAFMIENGRFVRYDVGNDRQTAPGGGKRGMSAERLRALYAGRTEERDHKYVDGGKYLRVMDSGGGDGILVFETDAAGAVTRWRAGVAPQVDYVEGCA